MSDLEHVDSELLAEAQRHVTWSMAAHSGRRDRARAVSYAHGLLGPTERKSVEPMLRAQLGGVHRARERRMTESLTDGDWSHQAVMFSGAERLVREIGARSPMRAYVIDDTALLKKGSHSVGVANQYAGCVGGLANCQVIVTLAMVNDVVHPLVAGQLFMPEAWFDEAHVELRERCRVPRRLAHKTKAQIARGLVEGVMEAELPRLPVLMDSAYGDDAKLRCGLARDGYEYVAMISSTKFLPLGARIDEPADKNARASGRPPTRLRVTLDGAPAAAQSYAQIAAALPANAWKTVTWRIGSKGPQTARFAAVRVRPASGLKSGGVRRDDLQPEQWLLLHWKDGANAPKKAWLSNLAADASLETLVQLARLRWSIERAHQETKGDIGLDHYEGRTYPGLHHHLALAILAHQTIALCQLRNVAEVEAPTGATSPSASNAAA